MPSRVRAVFLFVVLLALPVLAGNYRWTTAGPDGGFADSLQFDPADPSIVYAGTSNGLFRSSDGGVHWTGAAPTLGKSVFDIAIAADNPRIVFTSTAYGLYRSEDRGLTWRAMDPQASYGVAVSGDGAIVYNVSASGPMRSSDGGVTFGATGNGLPVNKIVTAIVVDPRNADVVYSLLTDHGVYQSVNGGAQWTAVNNGLSAAMVHYSMVIDPLNPSTLYLGSSGAIHKTTDGGGSWAPVPIADSPYVYALAISSSSPSTILSGADRGLQKSTDGGLTWSAPVIGPVRAVAIDPLQSNNVLATLGLELHRSTDGGSTFTPVSAGLTAHYTLAIASDPRNASIVYAGGLSGVSKSTDRGQTWTALDMPFPVLGLAVDPMDSSIVYAMSIAFLHRSVDGGNTWEEFFDDLPRFGSVRIVIPDPRSPGTLFASAGRSIHRMSADGTWQVRNSGLPESFRPTFITVDPNSSATYTGGFGSVFKSTDDGATWVAIHAGIETLHSYGLAVDPFDSNHLFTWSYDSVLYESTNGGASWSAFARWPGAIVFDPGAPGRIYARQFHFHFVQRSNDGGRTWQVLGRVEEPVDVSLLVVAAGGRTLYGGGSRGGVWTFEFGRRRAAEH